MFKKLKRFLGKKTRQVRNIFTKKLNSFYKSRDQLEPSLSKEIETYAKIAYEAYNKPNERKQHIEDFIYMKELSSINHGVYRHEFKKIMVLGIKGTSRPIDVIDDLDILSGSEEENERFKQDLQFYDYLVANYPNYQIKVVGHSLSGGIANYIGRNRENATGYAFNAGAGFTSNRNTGNIINYTTGNDLISLLQGLGNKNTKVIQPRRYMNSHTIKNFF